MLRPTHAVIDLNKIKNNILAIKNKVGNNTKILIAVKADAYGHGAIQVSKLAEKINVDMLGVATIGEGIELRNAGIKLPILLLGHILPEEVEEAINNNLIISVGNKELIEKIKSFNNIKNKVNIFIKVDTGMGRVGIYPFEETFHFIKEIYNIDNIFIQGVFTHMPSSDESDKSFSYKQIEMFKSLRDELLKENIKIPIFSMANSGAILDLPESYFDMVRPGIMIYGTKPSNVVSDSVKIEEALTLKSKITFLKRVKKGTTLGYGRTYTVEKDNSLIATIPIGYADGYNRLLSNKGPVLINGKRFKVSGRVSMDQITVDLGPDENVNLGDEVVLIGKQGNEFISVHEIANLLGTITYEVTCWISKRVPRIYINAE